MLYRLQAAVGKSRRALSLVGTKITAVTSVAFPCVEATRVVDGLPVAVDADGVGQVADLKRKTRRDLLCVCQMHVSHECVCVYVCVCKSLCSWRDVLCDLKFLR